MLDATQTCTPSVSLKKATNACPNTTKATSCSTRNTTNSSLFRSPGNNTFASNNNRSSTKEEFRPTSSSQELLPDVPSLFDDQGGVFTQPSKYSSTGTTYPFVSTCCCDSPRESQGRDSSHSYRSFSCRQTTHVRSHLLRLYCRETWFIRGDDQCRWNHQISNQGRYSTADTWRLSHCFSGFSQIEVVGECCRHDHLWFDPRPSQQGTPILLHVESKEDKRISAILYSCTSARILSQSSIPTNLSRGGSFSFFHHRMVEYQFECFPNWPIFQISPTLHRRTTQHLQDLFGTSAQEILQDILCSDVRGLLRLV